MTLGEVSRAVESKARVAKTQAQERATFDYILADLIVRGVSKCLGGKEPYPTLEKVYPTLFTDMAEDKERKEQEQRDKLSAIRFQKFAEAHNKKFNKEETIDNERTIECQDNSPD